MRKVPKNHHKFFWSCCSFFFLEGNMEQAHTSTENHNFKNPLEITFDYNMNKRCKFYFLKFSAQTFSIFTCREYENHNENNIENNNENNTLVDVEPVTAGSGNNLIVTASESSSITVSGSLLETDFENLTNNELEYLLLFGSENLTESEPQTVAERQTAMESANCSNMFDEAIGVISLNVSSW